MPYYNHSCDVKSWKRFIHYCCVCWIIHSDFWISRSGSFCSDILTDRQTDRSTPCTCAWNEFVWCLWCSLCPLFICSGLVLHVNFVQTLVTLRYPCIIGLVDSVGKDGPDMPIYYVIHNKRPENSVHAGIVSRCLSYINITFSWFPTQETQEHLRKLLTSWC